MRNTDEYKKYRSYFLRVNGGIMCPCGAVFRSLGSRTSYYNQRTYNQEIERHIPDCTDILAVPLKAMIKVSNA